MLELGGTYVRHEQDPENNGGMKRVSYEQAKGFNEQGFGVFWSINSFSGRRKKEYLTRINAWAIEIDGTSKKDMLVTIRKGLVPSLIVETKNGYHVYWKAKNPTLGNFQKIMNDRLVPFYKADPRSKDLSRVLRVPGFYHLKDPCNPFLVRRVWEFNVSYSEQEMLRYYPDLSPERKRFSNAAQMIGEPECDGPWRSIHGFWDRVYSLNCQVALEKLSGSEHVLGETYEFQDTSDGKKNIHVNGKSTSCWIDANGRIGSMDGGGPTVFQWLNWIHEDREKVIEIIKKEFLECQTK